MNLIFLSLYDYLLNSSFYNYLNIFNILFCRDRPHRTVLKASSASLGLCQVLSYHKTEESGTPNIQTMARSYIKKQNFDAYPVPPCQETNPLSTTNHTVGQPAISHEGEQKVPPKNMPVWHEDFFLS